MVAFKFRNSSPHHPFVWTELENIWHQALELELVSPHELLYRNLVLNLGRVGIFRDGMKVGFKV